MCIKATAVKMKTRATLQAGIKPSGVRYCGLDAEYGRHRSSATALILSLSFEEGKYEWVCILEKPVEPISLLATIRDRLENDGSAEKTA